MVPLGEQKQEEVAQTYKTSCRYVTKFGRYFIFGLCIISLIPFDCGLAGVVKMGLPGVVVCPLFPAVAIFPVPESVEAGVSEGSSIGLKS